MNDFHWTFGECLTFLLYLFASVGSWRLAVSVRRISGYSEFREGTLWYVEAILLLLLAVNAGSGGLSRLTIFFRSAAMSSGWYPERGPAQLLSVLALLVALVYTAIVSFQWARRTSVPAVASLMGSVILVAFVILRAVSLHAIDRVLFARIASVTFSSMIEEGSILTILVLMLWRREQLV
jgi:hypothetical protein